MSGWPMRTRGGMTIWGFVLALGLFFAVLFAELEPKWGWVIMCFVAVTIVERVVLRIIVGRYKRSAHERDPKILYRLACAYESGTGIAPDEMEATIHFQTAAELGHAAAMYKYAERLEAGLGCNQDEDTALKWIGRAAAAGYGPAKRLMRKFES